MADSKDGVRVLKREDFKDAAGIKKYRTLLSCDGGGLRGLISCQVLIELEAAIKNVILNEKDKLLKDPSSITNTKSFEVDLGEFFDQLAGTSTGGLLALYFAARGGSEGKSYGERVGSAANAAGLYKQEGKRIFGTSDVKKAAHFATSGGQYQHTADGLEGVLKDVFGEGTLSSLKTSVVTTTVDVDNARTGIFFYKASKADWEKKKGAADGTSSEAGSKSWGFACPLRRSKGSKVLIQKEKAIKTKQDGLQRSVGQMYLSNLNLEDPEDAIQGINQDGYWMTPMEMKTGLDFKLWEVARTTSAAPCFLPPIKVAPVNRLDSAKAAWPEEGIRFIDGGLANNDPTWMGLSMMLLADNRSPEQASIANTAILSIGTGTATTCSAYQPGKNVKESVEHYAGLLPALIGLAMNTNGEDKENILAMLFYGLLRAPRGQYMRIQLKQTDITGRGLTSSGGNQQGATTSDQEVLPLSREQVSSLDKMDDPDAQVLDAYEQIGKQLARNYSKHLEHFVRCYVFNLDDPYKTKMPQARI